MTSVMQPFTLGNWGLETIRRGYIQLPRRSQFDSRILINERWWAVTLIRSEGWIPHVMLVIESTSNCKTAVSVGHLVGGTLLKGCKSNCAQVNYENRSELGKSQVPYRFRSQTWKLPAQNVRKMIDAIVAEIGQKHTLNILGRYSYLNTGQDSCMTWAIEKLKLIKIALPQSWLSNVITLPHQYIPYAPKDEAPLPENHNVI